jgi:hypothetical protein
MSKPRTFIPIVVTCILLAALSVFFLPNCSSLRSNSVESSADLPHPGSKPVLNSQVAAGLDATAGDKTLNVDEAWATLPEIGAGDESEALEIPFVSGEMPSPITARESVPPPALPTISIPGALWQAGLLNGHPANQTAEVLPGEYGPDRPGESVLHIRDPAELPAFLHPNQQMVLYLPGMSQGLYSVHVATTGGNLMDREPLKNHNLRLLALRWNDHLIWQRRVDPFHSIQSALVPPQNVDAHANRLILENQGLQPLPLDAVWLSVHSRGTYPFYVAMERAEWMNQEESKWIRTVVLELSPPPAALDLRTLPARVPKPPPLVPADLAPRWREAGERYQQLVLANPSAAEALRPWLTAFSKAVSRGMIPSVTLTLAQDQKTAPDLAPILYVFGDMVHTWFLPGRSADRVWAEQLASLAPESRVVSPSKAAGPGAGPWLRFQNASYDFPQQHYPGRQRNAFFAGELTAEALGERTGFLLNTKANFHGYMWDSQCYHSYVFHRWVTQNLMANDFPVVVHGGHAGGPFFPAGDDTPGLP